MTPKILVLAGSIRAGAYSGRTADAAWKELALQGAEVTRISLEDYPLPIMDQNLEAERGVPENAVRLARLFAAHDGVLLATPEYNASVPPLLKNAIDWISRVREDGGRPLRPLPGRVAAICSSSSSHFGGVRAAAHLRQILVHLQMEVVSPQCSVPNAADAFDADGGFREERSAQSMRRVCATLIEHAWLLSARTRGERL